MVLEFVKEVGYFLCCCCQVLFVGQVGGFQWFEVVVCCGQLVQVDCWCQCIVCYCFVVVQGVVFVLDDQGWCVQFGEVCDLWFFWFVGGVEWVVEVDQGICVQFVGQQVGYVFVY